jgi:Uma2 family endonuclease
MPKYPPHCNACDAIVELLNRLNLSGYYIRSQNPITTSDSEPEPDVSVARGSRAKYKSRHPGPKDSALVIEVADSSLERDRGIKKRVYARAGVPVYWIVNLNERQLEVYSQPFGARDRADYGTVKVLKAGKEAPLILDGKKAATLRVKDLFG